MALKTLLENTGENIVKRLRANLAAKNINASGRLSASIESNVTESNSNYRLLITAFDYIFDVENGISPEEQKKRDWYELRDEYVDWIKNKPVSIPSDFETAEDLAAAMVVTTRSLGTVTYRSGQPSGALSDVINEQTADEINREIAEEILSGFLVDVGINISR